jgi:Domain of unknown function (DUF1707)/Cell wall-active antibiotics response 4TMS YvqF
LVNESPELRVSDADREAAVTQLRKAGGEGRLTFEELADRVGQADAARTRADLDALVSDLPATQPGAAPAERKERSWVVAVMGGAERKGRWHPAPRTNVVTVMGGAAIDLRDARIDGPELEITAVTIMGGIEVIVPEGVAVEIGGFALLGGNTAPRQAPVAPGAPVVRVRAYSLMGGIGVSRKRARRSVHGHLHGHGHG